MSYFLKNISPGGCHPPHKVTHPEKLKELIEAFRTTGWDMRNGTLVGYRWEDGRVQLITGSHRHAAAKEVGLAIPVKIVSYEAVWEAWGDVPRWLRLLAA